MSEKSMIQMRNASHGVGAVETIYAPLRSALNDRPLDDQRPPYRSAADRASHLSNASHWAGAATILSQEQIADQIYSLWLQAEPVAKMAVPGQFVSVYSNDSGRLLPRPISICETDPERGALRLVYRVVGAGTAEFSGYRAGDSVDIVGPLGNGYPLERCPVGRTAFLIGGGIGLPPMVELAKRLEGNVQVIAGYRDELFLTNELAACGELYLSIEHPMQGKTIEALSSEPSAGYLAESALPEEGCSVWAISAGKVSRAIRTATHGNVIDCIREHNLQADVIYACGPTPMLRAVKAYAQEHGIECWLSLEQRMACGVGACLACVCESTEVDAHSQVKNKRVCKEGPVFAAEDVVL